MHVDDFEIRQRGHDESEDHHGGLRDHKHFAPVYVVSNYAADERKQQNGKRCGKADYAKPESGVGKLKHQPALGDVLHPGADVGEEIASPEEPEIAMAKSAGEARNLNDGGCSRVSYSRVCNGPEGHAIDG